MLSPGSPSRTSNTRRDMQWGMNHIQCFRMSSTLALSRSWALRMSVEISRASSIGVLLSMMRVTIRCCL